ncbi:hypothetical protein [Aliikangiella maris]|uniref:Uncharacterized protein n=2 Tax=Aliikangiella maris TaxID=3162458 RepID=A0ABV2BSR2_9GAMM
MPVYSIFGLNIESDIQLPAITSEGTDIQITIRQQAIDNQLFNNELIKSSQPSNNNPYIPVSYQQNNELWFCVENIASFYVGYGNLILYQPEEGAEQQDILLYLLGTCLGIIMHQRGSLVLHANAIQVEDGCIIFMGKSGQGKSTLAAGFLQAGCSILTDDLTVINHNMQVEPAIPQLKLWDDSIKRLGIKQENGKRINLHQTKFNFSLSTGFCKQALPIRAIYELNVHQENTFKFERIFGMKKFIPLRCHTYRKFYLAGLGLTKQHLKLCANLAAQVNITRLSRPAKPFMLNEMIQAIKQDLAQQFVA